MCKFESQLYAMASQRVPAKELKGINSLIERKHYGVAEKHVVSKLRMYIEELEQKLGMDEVPRDPKPVWMQESELATRVSSRQAKKAFIVQTLGSKVPTKSLIKPL